MRRIQPKYTKSDKKRKLTLYQACYCLLDFTCFHAPPPPASNDSTTIAATVAITTTMKLTKRQPNRQTSWRTDRQSRYIRLSRRQLSRYLFHGIRTKVEISLTFSLAALHQTTKLPNIYMMCTRITRRRGSQRCHVCGVGA